MLLLTDRVYGFAEMSHDMDAVEDDLLRRLRHARPRRLHIGLPPVHRDGLDAVELLRRQPRVVAVKTTVEYIAEDRKQGALIQVADQRELAMALGRRLLIHPDSGHDPRTLTGSSPRDRPLHPPPRLVPADPHDPRGPAHVTLTQHVDGQALKQ